LTFTVEAIKTRTQLPDKVPTCGGLVGSTVGRPVVELTTSPLLDSVPSVDDAGGSVDCVGGGVGLAVGKSVGFTSPPPDLQ